MNFLKISNYLYIKSGTNVVKFIDYHYIYNIQRL